MAKRRETPEAGGTKLTRVQWILSVTHYFTLLSHFHTPCSSSASGYWLLRLSSGIAFFFSIHQQSEYTSFHRIDISTVGSERGFVLIYRKPQQRCLSLLLRLTSNSRLVLDSSMTRVRGFWDRETRACLKLGKSSRKDMSSRSSLREEAVG